MRFVNDELRPDLVVNTGDIVMASPDLDHDRRAAYQLHSAFAARVLMLPGNHDIGEPGENAWKDIGVTSERVAAHRAQFGADRFLELTEDWALLGVNSELFSSGLPEEDEQWEWLSDALARIGERLILLLIHKPLWKPTGWTGMHQSSIADGTRERLLTLHRTKQIQAVGSGHLHRYRRMQRTGLLEVWAPSTAFMGQTALGEGEFGQLGVVEWRLGASSCEASFRAPIDLEEVQVAEIPEIISTIEMIEHATANERG